MSDTHANETLTFTDAFFLYLEQPGAPLNVASIGAFEGVIPLDLCMEYVESKLPLLPRFLQRPATSCIGPPTWQYDPHFDIHNHVREITLKRGTETEWKSAVSAILSTHLDRSRPLWEITLLQGLKSDRTGVIVKVHHCMVDGIAGVAMLNALLDPNPVAPPLHHKKPSPPVAPPPHDPGTALLDGLINTCFSTAQALLTAHSELLRMAQQATASRTEANGDHSQTSLGALASIAPLGGIASLLSELAQPTERLPFNVLCRGPQKFDWAEIPMAEIVAVKEACGTTVNDVVLATLSMALRRYAELHEVKVKGRKLRLVIPVNVRPGTDTSTAGNQITFLPVDIPWSVREPRAFLSLVQERVKFSKTAHGAELVGLIALLLSAMPTSLQSLAGSILSQLPISVCNSICTNVPGPRTPLYLLGHKMLSMYPYVPIGGEMGMNCAVMSYNGTLFIGFTGDAQAIPDIARLAEFFTDSFVELRDAAGIRVPKNKRARPKPKAVPEQKAVPRQKTVPRRKAVPQPESVSQPESVPTPESVISKAPEAPISKTTGVPATVGDATPSESAETAVFA